MHQKGPLSPVACHPQVPDEMLSKCRLSYIELGDPVPFEELSKKRPDGDGADHVAYIESCIQGILKVSDSPFCTRRKRKTRGTNCSSVPPQRRHQSEITLMKNRNLQSCFTFLHRDSCHGMVSVNDWIAKLGLKICLEMPVTRSYSQGPDTFPSSVSHHASRLHHWGQENHEAFSQIIFFAKC